VPEVEPVDQRLHQDQPAPTLQRGLRPRRGGLLGVEPAALVEDGDPADAVVDGDVDLVLVELARVLDGTLWASTGRRTLNATFTGGSPPRDLGS